MRRRRRTRGTWLPAIGTFIDSQNAVGGREFIVVPGTTGTITTTIFDLTFDRPIEGDAIQANDTLAQVIGSEYLLQRIVGKVFLARRGIIPDAFGASLAVDRGPGILVTCGFFVARANDDQSGGGLDTPIGSATEPERTSNYSPVGLDAIREPWIWRRSWILGSAGVQWVDTSAPRFFGQASDITDSGGNIFPATNAGYGSLSDGPHIDSKVKRRIRQDDRLWFAASAVNYPITTSSENHPHEVLGFLDYRLFGSLRRAKNRSAF